MNEYAQCLLTRRTYTALIYDTAKQLVMPASKKKRRETLKRLWDSIELLFPEVKP